MICIGKGSRGSSYVIGHTRSGKSIYGSRAEFTIMEKISDPGMPHPGWQHSDLLALVTGMSHEHVKRVAERLNTHGLVLVDGTAAGRPRGIWAIQKRHFIED